MAAAGHPLSFYLKIGAGCFALGASMEMFMIKTGFYEKYEAHLLPFLSLDHLISHKLSTAPADQIFIFFCRVVELEAQRIEETREDREQFLRALATELEKQAAKKNVKLAIPKPPPSTSE